MTSVCVSGQNFCPPHLAEKFRGISPNVTHNTRHNDQRCQGTLEHVTICSQLSNRNLRIKKNALTNTGTPISLLFFSLPMEGWASNIPTPAYSIQAWGWAEADDITCHILWLLWCGMWGQHNCVFSDIVKKKSQWLHLIYDTVSPQCRRLYRL